MNDGVIDTVVEHLLVLTRRRPIRSVAS